MKRERNNMDEIATNTIYGIVNQLVYTLFITPLPAVFVTIFAGEGQKIAPKTNSPRVETLGYKYSTPTELVHATLFFAFKPGSEFACPQFIGESPTTPILTPFFLIIHFEIQSTFKQEIT